MNIPWASAAAQARVHEILAADGDALERADAAIRAHTERMERGLVLYAGTNAGGLGARPSLGDPGEKLQPGLEHLDVLEVLTTNAVAATMRAPHADIRVQSATLANLAVYAGLTPVGATIAALPPARRRPLQPSRAAVRPASAATASSSCRTRTSTSTSRPCRSSSTASGRR